MYLFQYKTKERLYRCDKICKLPDMELYTVEEIKRKIKFYEPKMKIIITILLKMAKRFQEHLIMNKL